MKKIIVSVLLLCASTTVADDHWLKSQADKDAKIRDWVDDVTAHRLTTFKTYNDRLTYVHEMTHFIAADTANILAKERRKNFVVIYVGDGWSAFFEEPPLSNDTVAAYLPKKLRLSRYDTYFNLNREAPTAVSRFWDEWAAYTNETQCLVADEAKQPKDPKLKTDTAEACLEFSLYATASMKAMHDKKLLTPTIIKVFEYQFKRANQSWLAAMKFDRFRYRPETYNIWETGDAKVLKTFLKKETAVEWQSK